MKGRHSLLNSLMITIGIAIMIMAILWSRGFIHLDLKNRFKSQNKNKEWKATMKMIKDHAMIEYPDEKDQFMVELRTAAERSRSIAENKPKLDNKE